MKTSFLRRLFSPTFRRSEFKNHIDEKSREALMAMLMKF
jgi:hypothetical protein